MECVLSWSQKILKPAFDMASNEALQAFGDATLFVERYVQNARHVEAQVIADNFGKVIHVGLRDCSPQRHHQKVIEEAYPHDLPDDLKRRILESAVTLISSIGYNNAGTVEFLVDKDRNEFYFMEVNTRIQVEHPVTEEITCYKGCPHCCFHYVAVPLAHGMVIVDYLYKQRQKLKQFIQSYDKWRHQGLNISNRIDRERARAFSLSMPVNDIIAVTRPLSAQYFEANITCPFLVNQTCLIYNIQPFPCSGQYSVTPPDLCAPDTADKAVIYQLVHDDEDLIKFLELAGADLMVNEMTLPIMVYRLLTQGASSVLDSLDVQNRVGSSRKVAAY